MSARGNRIAKYALLFILAMGVGAVFILGAGLTENWVRGMLVTQIERRTGARVELGGFHLHVWGLRAEIDNLTLHGLEAADQPPLFHANRIDVRVRILSFFGRQIALDELAVQDPEVALRIDRSGHSNLPTPQVPRGNRPWREALFQLRVGQLSLRDGSVLYNDQRTALNVDGRNFDFTLHYDAPGNGADSYVGSLGWQQVRLAARRDMPFRFDLLTKFVLHRDSFEVDQLVLKAMHSELDLSAELPSFARSDWDLKYRGRVSLADVRKVFRQPTTPDGDTDFSGQAHYLSVVAPNATGAEDEGAWTASGHYASTDIAMPYRFFHDKNIATSGDYTVANRRLTVPNLMVHALGGTITGRVEMAFKDLAFRTTTQTRGVSLAQLFDALDNDELPVRPLHWDGNVEVDSVNTWNANFLHFRTTGEMRWAPPATLAPGTIPATAHVEFDYGTDHEVVTLSRSEMSTPKMQIDFDGPLGAIDSSLEVNFRADDLLEWNDFIAAIRGPESGSHRIAGSAAWRGRILGPLGGPAFSGRFTLANVQYDTVGWDRLDAEMEYSPSGFILRSAALRRGRASASLNLSLEFDGAWNFLPTSPWSLDGDLEHASTDDLQGIFETRFPVTGDLSGEIHARGTRAAPVVNTKFLVENIEMKGWRFDRFNGQLHWQQGEIHLSHAELHEGAALVAGDIVYRPTEQQTEFNVTGRGIQLEKIKKLQTAALPIGGQLQFSVHGNGPLRAPVAQGDMHVLGLKMGTEPEGDFSGHVASDGRAANLSLTSEPAHEKLQGQLTVGLTGDEPVSGRLSVTQFDLDPFIVAGLHLQQLTGHSSADGVFTITGNLRQPDSIEVGADIAKISFNYELVQLTNEQNIRIAYRRNEIRIEQARLNGPDTDMQLEGSARFDRDRRIDFTVSGGVNLRLVKSFLPDLDAQGRAEANISVQGTMAQPRVTGRASVRDAVAHYADFPVGLSKVNGNFVFDRSRLLFEKVTAESGGGQLTLDGTLTYGDGPMRYEVTATTPSARIRYPTGMSWLAGGTIELSGTPTAALLSGHVQVERLLFTQNVDVAAFFASASDTAAAPTPSSPFLQNLAFDIEGQTNAGARIEWTGAHVDIDGNVRLRGTWDRPVLLGHIHLLGGEMPFRGNTFELTRGDINFANPFRLDPVLNVEATSTINQYQLTIDFSGPASHLALNYRSDPPLPDSDIVALLALGSPGEGSALRSSPGSGQNYGATALLSEAISSGVGGRIEHLFGISSFRVDPFVAGTATEANAAARVTIQKQIANDLTITYSTNAATTNQYQLIQVEYTVRKGLSVVFLRDINGTNGLDVEFVKHRK